MVGLDLNNKPENTLEALSIEVLCTIVCYLPSGDRDYRSIKQWHCHEQFLNRPGGTGNCIYCGLPDCLTVFLTASENFHLPFLPTQTDKQTHTQHTQTHRARLKFPFYWIRSTAYASFFFRFAQKTTLARKNGHVDPHMSWNSTMLIEMKYGKYTTNYNLRSTFIVD